MWKSVSITWQLYTPQAPSVDINTLFHTIFERFPLIFAEKRYKLINFAPKWEIVDNYPTALIINQKELTPIVDSIFSHGENEISKKIAGKFSTYPRHIIKLISIFKRKKRENIKKI